MNLWTELVTTAVVGTARQALPAVSAGMPLHGLLAQLDQTDREGALLRAAALAALYEGVGRLPVVDSTLLPDAAPPETLPCCNRRVTARLKLLLQGQYAELLPELLRELARLGQRVPEEVLPLLLEVGKTERISFGGIQGDSFPELVPPVVGARGRWLGQRKAEWAYVVEVADPDTLWQTGTLAQRRALLKRLRQLEPARARSFIEQTWEQDSANERATFIEILDNGLSDDDEPLLERALDMQWSVVRKSAAQRLAQLPNSAYVQRMCERARRLLHFKKSLLGKLSIEVELPTECDETMARDGLVRARTPQSGERAGWLKAILNAVPPPFWQQVSGWSVEEILKAIRRHEYRELLLESWREAALKTRAADWLELLLPFHTGFGGAQPMVAAMPRERQEQLLLRLMNEPQHWKPSGLLSECVVALTKPWSESFSQEVLDGFCARAPLETFPDNDVALRLLSTLVGVLHPATLPAALERLGNGLGAAAASNLKFHDLLARLQFRYDMLQELHQ